jgi:hypothetical protein
MKEDAHARRHTRGVDRPATNVTAAVRDERLSHR